MKKLAFCVLCRCKKQCFNVKFPGFYYEEQKKLPKDRHFGNLSIPQGKVGVRCVYTLLSLSRPRFGYGF